MSDVERHVHDYQVIVYTLGSDSVRQAICALLYDDHGGVFTPETTVTLHGDGSAVVSTAFASVIETEGQDHEDGLGAEHESAVPEGQTPERNPR